MSEQTIQSLSTKKNRYRRLWCILFLPLGVGLLLVTRLMPYATEQYYSATIYPVLVNIVHSLFGWIPFSVAEMALLFVPTTLLIFVAHSLVGRTKQERRERLKSHLATLIAVASCMFIAFVLLCGINYNRMSFIQYLDIEPMPASKEKLQGMCQELISRANNLRYRMMEDEQGNTQLTYKSTYELANASADSYARLGEQYPILDGTRILAKPVAMSELMSYSQITGIFIPYTMEALYNANSPDYSLPATICHEMTHVKGFMREDEANYIAYLACEKSEDPQIVYSGVMLALVHSMNALYATDYNLYLDCYAEYSDGVRNDFLAYSEYWKKYDGLIAEISDKVNDTYLKANNQHDGVRSYGRMVDLLLAEYVRKTQK